MNLPARSAEERQAALARGAEVRKLRAETKHLLKMNNLGFAELLQQADENPDLSGMKVSEVLKALPGSGPVKATKAMERIGISPNRRLRGLSDRQRQELLEQFG